MLNEVINPRSGAFVVNFTSNGTLYNVIVGSWGRPKYDMNYMAGTATTLVYYGSTDRWADQAYRTITLDEPATGNFLTWLQDNAVKQ